MKKVLFIAAIAMCAMSCGNKAAKCEGHCEEACCEAAAEEVVVEEAVVEGVIDSAAVEVVDAE